MKKLTIILLSILAIVNYASAQRITVNIVGDNSPGFFGDGYTGFLTQMYSPHDVCMDAAHDIYFVDNGNSRIRKLSAATGIVTTVGGGGSSTADGVPAVSAMINPYYICINAAGDLFFTSNYQVKKIAAATGIITTIVNSSDSMAYSGDGGAATAATMNTPQGICIDAAGNLYIVDQGNNAIRKVTAATGIISTIAGNGTVGYTGDGSAASMATLNIPIAICTNVAGDIFFSDQEGAYIRQIDHSSDIISTIAGNGSSASGDGLPATSAGIGGIFGICTDTAGNIYIDDISCSCREINKRTGIIQTVAGSLTMDGYNGSGGNSLTTWLDFPYGLCVDPAGNIYIADGNNNRITKQLLLTHTPSFAYSDKQTIFVCPSTSFAVNEQLAITDLDSAQTETWTVVGAPLHGTLSGFPYTALSMGTSSMVTPTGISYLPGTGFSGTDSFQVKISDGSLSEVVTIYVSVPTIPPDAGIISGPDSICTQTSTMFSETIAGGMWSNGNTLNAIDVNGNIYPVIAGPDTLLYTVVNGCAVTTTGITYVKLSPYAGTISGAPSVLFGDTAILSVDITGGEWISTDSVIASVSDSGIVDGVFAGGGIVDIEYAVTSGGCTGYSEHYIAVIADSAALSVKKTSIGINKMTIFPNPAQSYFSINISSAYNEQANIIITNITGEQIKEFYGDTNKPINVEMEAPAGIYLIHAASAHGNMSSKMVIE